MGHPIRGNIQQRNVHDLIGRLRSMPDYQTVQVLDALCKKYNGTCNIPHSSSFLFKVT
jgi:hypothetical protein